MMLDLASVRLFILAVEFGNLTRAAQAAGTVQPVVSARLKGLEAALGRKLLERTPRYVRPTEDGLAFLAKHVHSWRRTTRPQASMTSRRCGSRWEPAITRSEPDLRTSSGTFAQPSH
ncbi:LysR family transcriptional regulator [Micromonospora sp. STR1s_5]|nr:LysR family transcriptional regulator [Micromonospora sp. STR1s_5]